MQKVKVEAICFQPTQTGFAGPLDRTPSRIVGIDLADQEDLIANLGKRFAHEGLGGAVAVHFGGVDQGHAKIDASAKR
jgi:hypothetical protein